MLTEEHKEKMRLGRAKSYAKLKKLKELEKTGKINEREIYDEFIRPKQEKQLEQLEPQEPSELFKNEKREPAKKVSCCDDPNNWYLLENNLPDERAAIQSGYREVCRKCLSLK